VAFLRSPAIRRPTASAPSQAALQLSIATNPNCWLLFFSCARTPQARLPHGRIGPWPLPLLWVPGRHKSQHHPKLLFPLPKFLSKSFCRRVPDFWSNRSAIFSNSLHNRFLLHFPADLAPISFSPVFLQLVECPCVATGKYDMERGDFYFIGATSTATNTSRYTGILIPLPDPSKGQKHVSFCPFYTFHTVMCPIL
jgi:hypothetical protein